MRAREFIASNIKTEGAISGAVAGGLIGGVVAGVPGAAIGAWIGSAIGLQLKKIDQIKQEINKNIYQHVKDPNQRLQDYNLIIKKITEKNQEVLDIINKIPNRSLQIQYQGKCIDLIEKWMIGTENEYDPLKSYETNALEHLNRLGKLLYQINQIPGVK